jgi:hypothetical protein
MENGHEIWYMECEELVQVRFNYKSSQGIKKLKKNRFSGCTPSLVGRRGHCKDRELYFLDRKGIWIFRKNDGGWYGGLD